MIKNNQENLEFYDEFKINRGHLVTFSNKLNGLINKEYEIIKEINRFSNIPEKIHNFIDLHLFNRIDEIFSETNHHVVINGIAGLGKTTLAIHYGHYKKKKIK